MAQKNMYSKAGPIKDERLNLQWKDIIAIIIAVYRVFLPWAVLIAGIYAMLLFLFDLAC